MTKAVQDSVIREIEEMRRGLWAESDGTLAGYARMVDRLGRECRERFLAGQAGKKGGRRPGVRRPATARGKTIARKGRKENEETAK